jgi:hypothetical protein
MKIRTRTALASLLSLGVAAALVGVSAPAATAATYVPGNIDSAAIATAHSITLDLSNVHYASTPSGLYLSVNTNGGGSSCNMLVPERGSYCWSSSDQSQQVRSNLNGVYTFDKLRANTYYQVEVYPYETTGVDTQYAIVKTLPAVPDAPAGPPFAKVATNGLSAQVSVQSTFAINDDTPEASLKYNIYARYDGAWHKMNAVLNDNKWHTVSKLPLNKSITFAATAVNSLGESPKSDPSNTVKLVPASPSIAAPTGVIWPDKAAVKWKKASAGAGHITKYVLTVKKGSKTIYKHSFSASKRSATVTKLHRKVIYSFSITAYNSYGKHTTSESVYGRSK